MKTDKDKEHRASTPIALRYIAPDWDMVLSESNSSLYQDNTDDTVSINPAPHRVGPRTLDITKMDRCIVGEAWGFKSPVCPECQQFGGDFVGSYKDAGALREKLCDFTEHFHAEHSDILEANTYD